MNKGRRGPDSERRRPHPRSIGPDPEVAKPSRDRDGAARLAVPRANAFRSSTISTDYVISSGRKAGPTMRRNSRRPLNVYGRSKLAGEVAVRESNPAALIVRTSSVYSPYGHNFVRTMLRLAETRDMVKVVNDQTAAPTSAADLAKALLTIMQQLCGEGATGGLYHVAGSGATTWFDFAAAIFANSARRADRVPSLEPILTSGYPTVAARPANSVLDCRKAAQVFGIRLPAWPSSLEACLDRIAAMNRENTQC